MAICRGIKGHEHDPIMMPRWIRLCDACRKIKGDRPSQAVIAPALKQQEKLRHVDESSYAGARKVLKIMERLVQ